MRQLALEGSGPVFPFPGLQVGVKDRSDPGGFPRVGKIVGFKKQPVRFGCRLIGRTIGEIVRANGQLVLLAVQLSVVSPPAGEVPYLRLSCHVFSLSTTVMR